MKIKYEIEDDRCLTSCPNGIKIGTYERLTKVSSFNCTGLCVHFISDDEKNQIVTCSYDKMNEGKA
jgi:hypothetical protein